MLQECSRRRLGVQRDAFLEYPTLIATFQSPCTHFLKAGRVIRGVGNSRSCARADTRLSRHCRTPGGERGHKPEGDDAAVAVPARWPSGGSIPEQLAVDLLRMYWSGTLQSPAFEVKHGLEVQLATVSGRRSQLECVIEAALPTFLTVYNPRRWAL